MDSMLQAALWADQAVALAEEASVHYWTVSCFAEGFGVLTSLTDGRNLLLQGFAWQTLIRNACSLVVQSYPREGFAACSSIELSSGHGQPGDLSCRYHHQAKALSFWKDSLDQKIHHLDTETWFRYNKVEVTVELKTVSSIWQ